MTHVENNIHTSAANLTDANNALRMRTFKNRCYLQKYLYAEAQLKPDWETIQNKKNIYMARFAGILEADFACLHVWLERFRKYKKVTKFLL